MDTALDDIRKKAWEAHAQQQYLIAEQHYRTLLREEASIDDVINLGALLRSQGRTKEGSSFYQKWINHFRSDERLLMNACNCWNDNQEPQLVLKYLGPLIQNKNISLRLKLCVCDALQRLERFPECISLLKQCLNGKSDDKEIWIRLGLAYSKEQILTKALEAFTEANRIDPDDLPTIANRITILKDLGHFEKAETLYMKLSVSQQLQADIAQAMAGLWMAENKLVEATGLYQHVCQLKPDVAGYWLNWAAALRGLRYTVAPYRVLQRGLCNNPENPDLQEALQQTLAEMARPKAAARCLEVWSHSNDEVKASHLFSRQFLGIGTASNDSQALANQARAWEKKCQNKLIGPLWPDTILEPLDGRKLGWATSLPTSLTISEIPASHTEPPQPIKSGGV